MNEKIAKLKAVLDLVDKDYTKTDDVKQALDVVLSSVKEALGKVQGDIETHRKSAIAGDTALHGRVDQTQQDLLETEQRLQKFLREIELKPGPPGEKGDRGDDGEGIKGDPGKDGSPDTAEDIRNKLELLDGEERLDAKYIKNLPKYDDTKNTRILGGSTALHALSDVDVSGIVPGQSIIWDGIHWIPYTPSGGGGNTEVYNENLAAEGSGSVYTLSQVPVPDSERIYRGGSRISVSGGDYTIAGAVVTLVAPLSTGETLTADYAVSA